MDEFYIEGMGSTVNCPPDFADPGCIPQIYEGKYVPSTWDCQAGKCVAVLPTTEFVQTAPPVQSGGGMWFQSSAELTPAQYKMKKKIQRLLLFNKKIPWRLAEQALAMGFYNLFTPEDVQPKPRRRGSMGEFYVDGMDGLGATLVARRDDVVALYNELASRGMNQMYPAQMGQVAASIQSGNYAGAWSMLGTLTGEAYRTSPDRILAILKSGQSPAFAALAPASGSGSIPKWAWWVAGGAAALLLLGVVKR